MPIQRERRTRPAFGRACCRGADLDPVEKSSAMGAPLATKGDAVFAVGQGVGGGGGGGGQEGLG